MKKLFLIPFLLLTSCTKYSEISFKDNAFYIKPDDAKISEVKNMSWRVGPLRRQEVSKGFRAQVSFPIFSRESLEKLVENFGIDSWLIKVKKRSFSVNTTLGYVYIPLIVPGPQGKSKYRRHQIKAGVVDVFYSAAAISKRFENFPCPAFEHDRYLDEFNIDNRTLLPDLINSGGALEDPYVRAKVTEFSYGGNILNGGKSLQGQYFVEIALYNSKEKKKKSNFVELPDAIEVLSEKRRNIRGCEGFEIPEKGKEVDKMKMFRWKK